MPLGAGCSAKALWHVERAVGRLKWQPSVSPCRWQIGEKIMTKFFDLGVSEKLLQGAAAAGLGGSEVGLAVVGFLGWKLPARRL